MRLALSSIALALAVQATDIQPGVEYEGPQRLRAGVVGISFELPAGWRGGLPQGSDFFLMAPPDGGGYVFAGADEMTVAEANEAMSERVPLGDGIVLDPQGEVTVDGSALVGRYAVEGSPEPLAAVAKTLVGDHGTGIYLIAAFTEPRRGVFESALDAVLASVTFEAPVEETPSGISAEALSGRKITRFFHGSGYSEQESLYLCGSGNFYRNAESGGFGWNASGAFQSKDAGTWAVEEGSLVLRYGDGSVATYGIEIDGSKLLLDGTRWFREPTDCR